MSGYLIHNGTVHTLGPEGIIPKGEVLVQDGLIVKVGKNLATPSGFTTIDAQGKLIMPGMIDAHCHAGLIEAGLGFEGNDINETSSPVTPELYAVDGINPLCESFSEGCQAGITAVATGPGSANVIGGIFAVLKTHGRTVESMLVRHPAAMKIAFGENPKQVYGREKKQPVTRMAGAALIRTWLAKAREYVKKKDRGDEPEYDGALESLSLVIRKQIPVKAHAHRADDILTALRIADEFDVDITLDHCTEGHLIADELARSGRGIIVGPSFIFKSKPEVRLRTFETVKVLVEKGALTAIMTDLPCSPLSFLPKAAGLAVREGLSEEDAMACVTINPAKILGIDHRTGSLEPGKDADLLIHDELPFTNLLSRNRLTMIQGEIVFSSLEQPC